MIVTKEFIEENKSSKGGWRFAQLAILRAGWPPVKGWKDRAIGMEISEEDAQKFVNYAKEKPPKSERQKLREAAQKIAILKRENNKRTKKRFYSSKPSEDSFLDSYIWRKTRLKVLKRDGAKCVCCGATPADGLKMHVDHIKPRKKYPELALDMDNLQVLCEICNHGKGNWDETDWRNQPEEDSAEIIHLRSIRNEGRE